MPKLNRNALSAQMVRHAGPGSYVDGNGRVHVRFVMDMHERSENRTLGPTSDSIKAVSLRKDVACLRHRISKP